MGHSARNAIVPGVLAVILGGRGGMDIQFVFFYLKHLLATLLPGKDQDSLLECRLSSAEESVYSWSSGGDWQLIH